MASASRTNSDVDDRGVAVVAPGGPASLARIGVQTTVASLRSGVLAVPAVLVLMTALFWLLRPDTFGTVANLRSLATTQAVLVILAVGVTVVLAVGEFDLSSAAVLGFSASIVADLTVNHGMNIVVAIAAALGMSLVVGLANAVFVVALGVNSFVTTLGMSTVLTGIALGTIGPTTIGGLPSSATALGSGSLLTIGWPFYYGVVVVVIAAYVLQRTATGRHIYFVGEGRAAAWLVGMRVNRIRVGGLITSSLAAGVAGIVLAAQTSAAQVTYGGPYLLPAYAAAFLGATMHRGRFGAPGTFLSVYLLAVGTVGLQMLGAPDWVTQVFSGGVLVVAVTFARLSHGSREA